MTAAQRLIEQGRDEGRQQGRLERHHEGLQQGLRELLLKQLRFKFGAPLPAEIVARVQRGRPDELEYWGERLLGASTLEQAFEEPGR